MDLKNIIIKSPQEYPEIIDAKRSPKTVAILKNLMSSQKSELSAILQYFYQSSVSDKIEKDIAELFEEISIIEMHHLSLLSKAIVDFGGEPKYENASGQFFNCSKINYTTKLVEMLNSNIKDKEYAIFEYEQAINNVENSSLKKLFKRIILDEELHIKALTHIKDNVKFMSY